MSIKQGDKIRFQFKPGDPCYPYNGQIGIVQTSASASTDPERWWFVQREGTQYPNGFVRTHESEMVLIEPPAAPKERRYVIELDQLGYIELLQMMFQAETTLSEATIAAIATARHRPHS